MKPANIILDLLRTYPLQGVSVKEITAVGAMFGFSENLMRVSLSRLAARKVIENIKRGQYRLSNTSDPINEFVEEWRLGEARLRPWEPDTWLCIHRLKNPDDRACWVMTSLGFIKVAEQFWLRPDNLHITADQLSKQMIGLGSDTAFILTSNARIPELLAVKWRQGFDIDALDGRYQKMTEDLRLSMDSLHLKTHEVAKKETFNLGGKAIQLLVKDPLMPTQWHAGTYRQELCKTLLVYDQLGREIWTTTDTKKPNITPTPQFAAS